LGYENFLKIKPGTIFSLEELIALLVKILSDESISLIKGP